MLSNEHMLDLSRASRTGLDEAIFCDGKTAPQIANIVSELVKKKTKALFTQLSQEKFENLPKIIIDKINYDPFSKTGILGQPLVDTGNPEVGIISAGTSDLQVAAEVNRTLFYYGKSALLINDVGVAGLWRLLSNVERVQNMAVVIAIAGMDAALPTVLGGLVSCPVIGVPTSVGYGVAKGGEVALKSMLSSCSSGLLVVNIDNEHGAACAAIRILKSHL